MTAIEKELHINRLLTLVGIAAKSAQDSMALGALSRMAASKASVVPADRMTLARIENGGVVANGQAQAHERANAYQQQAQGELRNLIGFANALGGLLSEEATGEEEEAKG